MGFAKRRKLQLLVDPTVNLAAQPSSLLPAKWIIPLVEPFPTREQRNDYIKKLTNRMNPLRRQNEETNDL